MSVEDALGAFRGKASSSGFFFHLMDYNWSVDETGAYQFQRKMGGFVIGKRIDIRKNPASARIVCRNQCETIANDFITHMVADSRAGHPLFGNSSDTLQSLKLNVQPAYVVGDGSYDGIVCTFEFSPPRDYELECHPVPAWQQLSPTEYDGTPPDTDAGGFWQLNDGGNWQGN